MDEPRHRRQVPLEAHTSLPERSGLKANGNFKLLSLSD